MPPHGKKFANHWHGSQPVQDRRQPVSKLGKPALKQRTLARHEALASVGPMTMATGLLDNVQVFNGQHFVDDLAFGWLLRNKLIELLPAERPGGARKVERTELGDRVLAAWNEKYGLIDLEF